VNARHWLSETERVDMALYAAVAQIALPLRALVYSRVHTGRQMVSRPPQLLAATLRGQARARNARGGQPGRPITSEGLAPPGALAGLQAERLLACRMRFGRIGSGRARR
jgi:hypothetical protein